ncbi:MAG TPA: hypothetical protein VGJ41_18385 [Nocardioides sp.]
MSQPPQQPMQPQQPQQPMQPMPPQQPMGILNLVIKGSMLTSNPVTPTVRLNGYPVQVKYGPNPISVPPGPVHIDVHTQWLRRYGQAGLDCEVGQGQTVTVHYAAPYHQFTTGSIGFTPQKRKGAGLLFGMLAVLVGFVLLVILLAVLS